MTLIPQTEKHWNILRLALLAVWAFCLGGLFLPVMMKTVEGFLKPHNELLYGWLVAPVAFLMALSKWKNLRLAAGRPTWEGLVLFLFSFMLFILGQHTERLLFGQLAMIISILAVAWTGWGRTVARLLFFPIVFLLFVIPLNVGSELLCHVSGAVSSVLMNGFGFSIDLFYGLVVDDIISNGVDVETLRVTNGLEMGTGQINGAETDFLFYKSANVAAIKSHGLDIAAIRKGVFLTNPSHDFLFQIADVCSGKRSVSAILIITSLYGFFHYKTLPRIFMLLACAIPFILLFNVFRIILMCVSAVYWGQGKTVELLHDPNGYIMFPVALVLIATLGDKFIYRIGRPPSDAPVLPPVRQLGWPWGITAILLAIALTGAMLTAHGIGG